MGIRMSVQKAQKKGSMRRPARHVMGNSLSLTQSLYRQAGTPEALGLEKRARGQRSLSRTLQFLGRQATSYAGPTSPFCHESLTSWPLPSHSTLPLQPGSPECQVSLGLDCLLRLLLWDTQMSDLSASILDSTGMECPLHMRTLDAPGRSAGSSWLLQMVTDLC